MECISILILGIALFAMITTAAKHKQTAGQSGKRINGWTGQTGTRQQTRQQTRQKTSYTMAGASYQNPEQTEDILARANSNIIKQELEKKNEKAEEKEMFPVSEQLFGTAQSEQIPEGENDGLMQEIEDIMAKGYDESLTFERDFVSEGIEMLNNIQE